MNVAPLSRCQRGRKVAEGRVKGVHHLMKKNAITRFDGRDTFTDPHTVVVDLADGAPRP
jgi:dihydrolipoamide dehydrogenase